MLNGQEPLLLEEPEISLHPGIVQHLAELIHIMQKRKVGKRQVIISTHSFDILNDKGISADEIVILKPDSEGTTAKNAYTIFEIRELLDTGSTPAEVVLPYTEPKEMSQLFLPFRE